MSRVRALNLPLLVGERVRIYRNLHNGLMSVQAKVNGNWRVVGHTSNIDLRDVTFKVSEAGRKRVIQNARKTVHAYLVGTVTEFYLYDCSEMWIVSYNPKKAPQFYIVANQRHIYAANYCSIRDCKVAVR